MYNKCISIKLKKEHNHARERKDNVIVANGDTLSLHQPIDFFTKFDQKEIDWFNSKMCHDKLKQLPLYKKNHQRIEYTLEYGQTEVDKLEGESICREPFHVDYMEWFNNNRKIFREAINTALRAAQSIPV